MESFKEWLKEMVGVSAIYDGTKGKDFQWWGSLSNVKNKPKKIKTKNINKQ